MNPKLLLFGCMATMARRTHHQSRFSELELLGTQHDCLDRRPSCHQRVAWCSVLYWAGRKVVIK